MGTFHIETTIDRPRGDVFAVIADPTAMPDWYEAVQEVTMTSTGPTTTGATYVVTRSLPGGKVDNTVEITEYEANRRVTLEPRRPHAVPVPLHPYVPPGRGHRDHPRRPHQRNRPPSATGRRRPACNTAVPTRHATQPRRAQTHRRIGADTASGMIRPSPAIPAGNGGRGPVGRSGRSGPPVRHVLRTTRSPSPGLQMVIAS